MKLKYLVNPKVKQYRFSSLSTRDRIRGYSFDMKELLRSACFISYDVKYSYPNTGFRVYWEVD